MKADIYLRRLSALKVHKSIEVQLKFAAGEDEP